MTWPAEKRGIDIALSLAALILLSPVMLVIVAAIKLESRGPVFHRARRVGYRGRPLMMLKFRKMHDGAAGAPLTAKADPRLTRVGAFLTRWRLDELPQFWDVLRGRMSIVGPRPEDPHFVALHSSEYAQILTVRPGIVGLSQLAYEAESQIVSEGSPVEDYIERILPQKLTLDKLYAANTHLRLDVSIFKWATVVLLFRRPVAVNRATGAMNVRRRRRPWAARALVPEPRTQLGVSARPVPEEAVHAASSEASTEKRSLQGTASSDAPSEQQSLRRTG